MLMPNSRGNFHFTKGFPFFAFAVVADPGFEIVHAVFEKPLPLTHGFDAIHREIQNSGRPMQALCGMELRAAAPYTDTQMFMEFNAKYVEKLRSLDLLVDGLVPMTRANLAVPDASVKEQCVYAFSYTVPSKTNRLTFATSGIADSGAPATADVSPAGLRERVAFVVGAVAEKLKEIEASWDLSTQIRLYSVHPVGNLIPEVILPQVGSGAQHGITWHRLHPPVAGLELEMDARRVFTESII